MNKKDYDVKYAKTKCKQIKLLLHNINDADIIEYLSKQTNVQGTLKSLIRKEIKNDK